MLDESVLRVRVGKATRKKSFQTIREMIVIFISDRTEQIIIMIFNSGYNFLD